MVEDLEMVDDDGGLREKCDFAVSAEAELHFTSLHQGLSLIWEKGARHGWVSTHVWGLDVSSAV